MFLASLDVCAPPVLLPDGVSVSRVADECREALLEFLEGTAAGFGKSGLAVWLARPYRMATRFAPREESPPRKSDIAPASVRTQLNSKNIDEILSATRQEVITTLKLARENASFARSGV